MIIKTRLFLSRYFPHYSEDVHIEYKNMFAQHLKIPNNSARNFNDYPGLKLQNAIDKTFIFNVLIGILVLYFIMISTHDDEHKLTHEKSHKLNAKIYKAEKSTWDNICSKLSYQFLVKEAEFSGYATVSRDSDNCSLRAGDNINVRYLSSIHLLII